jgi:predicted metalloprotease
VVALLAGSCAVFDDGADNVRRSDNPVESKRRKQTLTYDEQLAATIEDLQDWWDDELQARFDERYEPLTRSELIPYDEDDVPPPCGYGPMDYEEIAENAFYCPLGPYLAWDEEELFPYLYEEYGPFAISFVLAHEWAHVAQDQAGYFGDEGDEQLLPTILTELQADCFAGAWTRHVYDGESPELLADDGDLQVALGALLYVRDPPGTSVRDPAAHGVGFDRVNAFQEGFDEGGARCAEYPDEPPALENLTFSWGDDGNVSFREILELTSEDLNDFWAEVGDERGVDVEAIDDLRPFDLDEELPDCDGQEYAEEDVSYRVFYCEGDGYIGWDDEMLRTVHEDVGDFGVAALLSEQWATAFQLDAGVAEGELAGKAASLERACYTGAWAKTTYDGSSELEMSPGDLDEAIQAYLAFSEDLEELDEAEATPFERIEAFRGGFFGGEESCA